MSVRRLSRRQFVQVAIGISGSGLLAACGATPAPAATSAPAEATATTAPTLAPVEEVPTSLPVQAATVEAAVATTKLEGFEPQMTNPSEKIKLLYWWGNNYEPAMQFTHEIIKKFSLAYPNVEVEPVGGQNCDMFVTASAAGTPPDLFHTWDCVERMGLWAKRQMIIPLDDYVQKSNFPVDDYLPGVMDTCRWEGKTWGMVDTGGVFLLWYLPQQFSEIGQTAEAYPATTDELWSWAQQLTTRDANGDIQRMGMAIPTWVWTVMSYSASYGAELWNTDSDEPAPDNAGMVQGLTDLVKEVEFYGLDAMDRWSASIGSQGGQQDPWMAGNLTMKIDGDWSGQAIFDFFPDWKFMTDYGAAPPPPAPESKRAANAGVVFWSWPFVIPSGTKYPDWSWELCRFFLSPEYQVNVHAKFKEVLVRKSMMEDERLWWPAAQVARDMLKSGAKIVSPVPMHPVAGEYIDLLGSGIEKVLRLQVSPEEGMKQVKEEVQKKIQEVMG